MKNRLMLLVLPLAFACKGPDSNVTVRDEQGNYVTTSDFRSMDRAGFLHAMSAGLADFDQQLDDLRERANTLGGDALQTFAKRSETLQEKREHFVNQIARAEAALEKNWPDRREETLEAYHDLREELDEAYEDTLDT